MYETILRNSDSPRRGIIDDVREKNDFEKIVHAAAAQQILFCQPSTSRDNPKIIATSLLTLDKRHQQPRSDDLRRGLR